MKTIRKKIEKDLSIDWCPFTEVHVGSRLEICPTEIIMISAEVSYSFIHLKNGKKIIVSTNIQKLEERFLPFRNMVRVHRSTMVNTQFLKYVEGPKAFLSNDIQCLISRRKRNNLFMAIKSINALEFI